MNKYLIRFDQATKTIFAIVRLTPGVLILGLNNDHLVSDLPSAVTILEGDGFDVTPLLDELNKPEAMEE